MRGVLVLITAVALIGNGQLAAADAYGLALDARIARLERLLDARRGKGVAVRWKDPQTRQGRADLPLKAKARLAPPRGRT